MNSGGGNLTGSQLVSDGKLLYTSAGQVWDPTNETLVGTFPVTTYNATSYPNLFSLALDSTLGEIYGIGEQSYGNDSSALTISAFGQKTLSVMATLAFPQVGYPYAGNIVHWGSNGFAFIAAGANLTDQELYLTRSSVLAPTQPNPAPRAQCHIAHLRNGWRQCAYSNADGDQLHFDLDCVLEWHCASDNICRQHSALRDGS